MSNSLSEVWGQVENMLNNGLSVIPVRDKIEGDKQAKTPYYLWKKYQTERYSIKELWHDMEVKNTTAVSVVCGAISGNLEVIDIDVKFKSDAAVILFASMSSFDESLFNQLRIHKTPSGGFHVLYRVSDVPATGIPGNTKLAGRKSTEEELSTNPKTKIQNFLETRGEGGYILAPPSLSYTVYRDVPIPIISWQDRCNLIALCSIMNEEIKYIPQFKSTPKYDGYYDENPWDDFNKRADPTEIMERNGWIPEGTRNANNIYFTRPGKTAGISMSFREDIRKFYCFTASTDFENSRAYSPVDVILQLEHTGDKKACYCYLVNTGYGRVKSKVEQSMAISLARKDKPVPHNFSEAAVQLNISTIAQLKEDHPYGQFVKYDKEEEKLQVSREALVYVANNLGFRYHEGDTVRVIDNFIHDISEREFQDILKDYIHEEDPDEYERLCNLFESFMQKNGKYTMSRLDILDSSLILRDNKDVSHKFFKNGFLTITAQEITFDEYSDFDMLIWAKIIQPRDYRTAESTGVYGDFIQKAVIDQEQVRLIIGYLAHEYKDETTGYIIVLAETCADPKNGGGSGKNVFCNLLKLTTSYTSKPGAQSTFDEKFFQSWNKQRIFGISDVDKSFDFSFLKEPSTGSFIWKKLFKDEIEIPVEDAPKFIVQTNYSYEIKDGGLKRRIIPIEFTDYFTKAGGLDVHYGKHFPNEWSPEDYAGVDNYIASSIQLWLRAGRKLSATTLSETGWLKQWEQTYGQVACAFLLIHLPVFLKSGYVSNEQFKYLFDLYLSENNVPKVYSPSINKVNKAIAEWCEHNLIAYEQDKPIRAKENIVKCRVFERLPDCEIPF